MEKRHDRRGNLWLAMLAVTAVLLAWLLIWKGSRDGHSAYADAVLVMGPGEVRCNET